MARTLRIRWAPGETVTARLAPGDGTGAATGILLAPGAGAGQDHPWIVTLRDALAAAGFPTMTFDYRYREAGRRAPDRPERLLAVHRAAADRLARRHDRIVLAGKSMGSRIAGRLLGDERWPAAAFVAYGYPLLPRGRPPARPVDHLAAITVPQLYVTGSRDRLGPPDLLAPIVARLPDATLLVVAGGDHSLRLPARQGRPVADVLRQVAADTAAFLRRRLPQDPGGGT
jgi:Predicted hydrolase of the alpha/beta-hydrolase fold